MSDSDKTTYSPFILITGKYESLILSDQFMPDRFDVFEAAGWEGNGYDWTAVARVVIDEKLPALKADLEFDPEAGMFSAQGPLDVLKQLGTEMKLVFDTPSLLQDILSRAKPN